jgi:hypothetical protein
MTPRSAWCKSLLVSFPAMVFCLTTLPVQQAR